MNKKGLPWLVTLTIFGIAYLVHRQPTWVQPLFQAVGDQSFLVVIDEEVPIDPNHLQGLVWVSRDRLKRKHLKDLDQVFWLRTKGSTRSGLFGLQAKECRDEGPVQLCLVPLDAWNPWRLSQKGKGISVSSKSMTCKVTDLNKKCFYGQEDWEYLRREHHNFAGERRQCLWTHPVKEDAVTVVIPSLNSGSYRLVAGLDDSAVRGDLAAVELVISQGGAKPWSKQLTVPDRKGLHLLPLPSVSPREKVKITIRAKETGARFFCWDLERLGSLHLQRREAKEPPAKPNSMETSP